MARDHFHWQAYFYDPVIGRFNRILREIAMSMLPPCEGAHVLDVGCGTGMHLELYARSGCTIAGLDSSPAMLKIARKRLGTEADLREADALEMPFGDGVFDIVLASLFLHEHAPETRLAILRQMNRVMKPAGHMMIVDFHPGPIRGLKGHCLNAIITTLEFMAGRDHYRNSRLFLARQGLVPLVDELGMEIEEMKVVSGGNMGLYLLQRGETQ
ncbi:class I SAM-dependent methyltransferase [Gemmatimonadota bacterium]